MKFTLSWLKAHLSTDADAEVIADKLTAIGIEVESMIDIGKLYKPFVIGHILEAVPHPNADRLRVCTVDNGRERLQIVCGALNARAGIKVVLAPIGAVIPSGNFEIKAAKIRGVESCGMLCSGEELLLDLGPKDGIIELPEDAVVGVNFAEWYGLNDIFFDVALTPNRGDAASVHGIARDLYAAGIGTLKVGKHYEVRKEEVWPLSIEDKEGCAEFSLAYIKGVNNKVYTKGVAQEVGSQLRKIGCGNKTPLVDISNFCMFDFGRPNHIYDADKVNGVMCVRKSQAGEQFIALGGDIYTLPAGILVVSDVEKVLAVAGVMGGELSKVTEDTVNVLVEVANFHPHSVMRAGRELGLFSESRYRFERRVDGGNTVFAMGYIVSMIEALVGGQVVGSTTAHGKSMEYVHKVPFTLEGLRRLAGYEVEDAKVQDILLKLGFKWDGKSVEVPSHRLGDVSIEQDVIEEVLRIHGLDATPTLSIPLDFGVCGNIKRASAENIRGYLISHGFSEIITYPFISKKAVEAFQLDGSIEIANPISEDMKYMRKSQLPMILEHAARNIAYGVADAQYFELGKCYFDLAAQAQESVLSGMRVGKQQRKTHFKEEREVDFFDVKADIIALLELKGVSELAYDFIGNVPSYYHRGKAATIFMGDIILGYVGVLSPVLLSQYDINDAVVGFELFLDRIPEQALLQAKHSKISNLQAAKRDFAFEMDSSKRTGDVIKAIKTIDSGVIENVELFDVYQGTHMAQGRKSIGVSVTFRPVTETLSDVDISDLCRKIINMVHSDYGGIQR